MSKIIETRKQGKFAITKYDRFIIEDFKRGTHKSKRRLRNSPGEENEKKKKNIAKKIIQETPYRTTI